MSKQKLIGRLNRSDPLRASQHALTDSVYSQFMFLIVSLHKIYFQYNAIEFYPETLSQKIGLVVYIYNMD